MLCYFVSDLHGRKERYEKLFKAIINGEPHIVFLGGDLLPHPFSNQHFLFEYILPNLRSLKETLNDRYPQIFLILGNDDARSEEEDILEISKLGLWSYIHFEKKQINNYQLFGYSFTTPSPFLLKDWEKYDVSRYIDPGCISPEEGKRTVEISDSDKKYSTIKEDLDLLTKNLLLENAIFLFHAPPYKTKLDRAALDGKKIEHIPLDINVGSVAIRKFIELRQPLLTLHGHIHESARITGSWKDAIGRTYCFSAAHDGTELSLIKFELANLDKAERVLL